MPLRLRLDHVRGDTFERTIFVLPLSIELTLGMAFSSLFFLFGVKMLILNGNGFSPCWLNHVGLWLLIMRLLDVTMRKRLT